MIGGLKFFSKSDCSTRDVDITKLIKDWLAKVVEKITTSILCKANRLHK
jgi:hypothetical protein